MPGLTAFIVACGIASEVELLAAIVEIESGGSPIALSVNGAVELVRPPRDRDDAARMARWLAARGHSFDAGLAQVNSANLARLGLDVASVFEPCANLHAAAAVLDECRDRARARGLAGARATAGALSCYNTGHLSRGIRNGYVAAIRTALGRAPRRELAPGPSTLRTSPAFPRASRRPDAFALASVDAPSARGASERAP